MTPIYILNYLPTVMFRGTPCSCLTFLGLMWHKCNLLTFIQADRQTSKVYNMYTYIYIYIDTINRNQKALRNGADKYERFHQLVIVMKI